MSIGAAIRAVDRSGNIDTPEGLLVRRIVDAFAEYERLTIQARTKAAPAVKRSRRERISREPPTGGALIPTANTSSPNRASKPPSRWPESCAGREGGGELRLERCFCYRRSDGSNRG